MSRSTRPNPQSRTATIVILILIVLAIVWLLRGRGPVGGPPGGVQVGPGGIQDRSMTPGDVLTTDRDVICKSGYTQTVRNVPSSLKNQVYKEYGIASRKPGEYEVDHLISLELGGSNSIRNLWPQSYVTKPLNAHVKDALENKLHTMMCSGQIGVQEAQQAIAQDWTAAYVKYVGPLPSQ